MELFYVELVSIRGNKEKTVEYISKINGCSSEEALAKADSLSRRIMDALSEDNAKIIVDELTKMGNSVRMDRDYFSQTEKIPFGFDNTSSTNASQTDFNSVEYSEDNFTNSSNINYGLGLGNAIINSGISDYDINNHDYGISSHQYNIDGGSSDDNLDIKDDIPGINNSINESLNNNLVNDNTPEYLNAVYQVEIMNTADQKIMAIKIVRASIGCGLKEAKDIVEGNPEAVVHGLSFDDANELCRELNDIGCMARVIKDSYGVKKNYSKYTESRNISSMNSYVDNEDRPYIVGKLNVSLNNSGNNNINNSGNNRNNTPNNNPYKSQNNSQNNNTNTQNTNDIDAQKNKNAKKAFGIIASVVVFMVCAIVGMFVQAILNEKTSELQKENQGSTWDEDYKNALEEMNNYSGSDMEKEYIKDVFSDNENFWNVVFRNAFGKEVEEITVDELLQFVSIDYNRDESGYNIFKYELMDGTKNECYVQKETIKSKEFAYFASLEHIDSEYLNIMDDTFTHLNKLTEIGCDYIYVDDLSSALNTEKIKYFRAPADQGLAPFLEKCTNLETLILDDGMSADWFSVFDWSKMPDLKKLSVHIESGTTYDYSKLADIKRLESIYFYGAGLKNIECIKFIPYLNSFGLVETSVIDISPLENFIDQLNDVYLYENYGIDDYSVINEMLNLESLTVIGSSGIDDCRGVDTLTELKSKHIEKLGIGRNNHNDVFIGQGSVKELTLYSPYGCGMEFLHDMPELEILHIHDASLYSGELDVLKECSSIKELCLDDTFCWDDISKVINMKSLEKLDLGDATFGILPDKIETNKKITYLNLKGAKSKKLNDDGSWIYFDGEYTYKLSEVPELVENLESLQVLFIPEQQVEDVEFLSGLSELKTLDIARNYIADLTPIADFDFALVCTYDNSIIEDGGIDCIISDDTIY